MRQKGFSILFLLSYIFGCTGGPESTCVQTKCSGEVRFWQLVKTNVTRNGGKGSKGLKGSGRNRGRGGDKRGWRVAGWRGAVRAHSSEVTATHTQEAEHWEHFSNWGMRLWSSWDDDLTPNGWSWWTGRWAWRAKVRRDFFCMPPFFNTQQNNCSVTPVYELE